MVVETVGTVGTSFRGVMGCCRAAGAAGLSLSLDGGSVLRYAQVAS
jgi:hypothetical protein